MEEYQRVAKKQKTDGAKVPLDLKVSTLRDMHWGMPPREPF